MSRYEDLSDDGEVDHSFFDSEVDEVARKVEKNVPNTVKQKEALRDNGKKQENSVNVKAALETQEGSSSEGEGNEQPESRVPRDRHSTVSSAISLVGQSSESTISSGRNSAQSLKIRTTIPTGIPKIRRQCEDTYYTDEEDSSDEGKNRRYRPKSSKQPSNLRKNVSKKIAQFSSSSSSSGAEGSDSDSCRSKPSYPLTKINASASVATLSSPQRGSRSVVKSSEGNKKLQDYHEESEDTVTDVTPLSTPDISPIQSLDLAATNDTKKKMTRQENVSQEIYDPETEQKCNQKALHDAMDLNQLLKAFMHLDKKEQRNLVIDNPVTTRPKNYSFTNEEVRHIDRENQRLLKELSRQATKPRSKSTTLKPSGPPTRLYHSTVNRQREQLRIERDNMALLKRLESIKPTVGMTRSEQLMDYQRQAGYLSSSASSPRPVKSSSSRHSSSQGVSRVSSAGTHRSERSISSASSAALLRPTKSTNVRAAWM